MTKTYYSTTKHAYISCDILYIDDSVQGCSNSSALAMEILQSCTKPLISASLSYKWGYAKLDIEYNVPEGKHELFNIEYSPVLCSNALHYEIAIIFILT